MGHGGNERVSDLERKVELGSKLKVSKVLENRREGLADPSVDLSNHIRVWSSRDGNTDYDLCQDYQGDLDVLAISSSAPMDRADLH